MTVKAKSNSESYLDDKKSDQGTLSIACTCAT